MEERSLYVIKPEAMRHRDAILQMIVDAGFQIIGRASMILPDAAIACFYPQLDDDLLAASMKYLRDGPCEIGIVEGPNAIRDLLNLRGGAVNPSECAKSTVRYRYGLRAAEPAGPSVYYRNGFHCARDHTEARIALSLLSPESWPQRTRELNSPVVLPPARRLIETD